MCGISGIVDTNDQPIDIGQIQQITDAIAHRGPDDEGLYFGENFALGHRRLAILDLSDDGHQPMQYLDKYVITYNGEVYNYLEVRAQLQKVGYQFNSGTDTEVILAAYDYWGFDCVERFNGMWAFAIFDKVRNHLFCSRDRFGVKPFYYTSVDGKFVFGSEIKQLLEFYPVRYVNKSVLLNYIILRLSDHGEETFFEGVFTLLGGHNLHYDLTTHETRVEKYYEIHIDPSLQRLTEPDAIEEYRRILERSVEIRLRSDVKVGTCLSGGLDSSAIAAIAAKRSQESGSEKFSAITASSLDQRNDETHYAELVARSSNLDWHVVKPSHEDFANRVQKMVYAQDQPVGGPSALMQNCVFAKAQEIGCTVMLDGQGGDETLLGYERYYPSYLLSLPFWKIVGGIWRSSERSALSRRQILMYCIYFLAPKVRKRRILRRNRFVKQQYLSLVDWPILQRLASSYTDCLALQKLEVCELQMPHLLRYEDRNSMAFSIESRLPFVDYRHIETALALPGYYKLKSGWTKYVLRKATDAYLPKAISWRTNKRGFEAPGDIWMRRFATEIDHTIRNSSILNQIADMSTDMDNRSKWQFYFIAKWEQAFQVRMRP